MIIKLYQMKKNKTIFIAIFIFLPFLFLGSVFYTIVVKDHCQKIKENISLVNRATELEEQLKYCTEFNKGAIRQLEKMHNHVYRMQLIAGVKNPDSVFTYAEKIRNPIKTKALTD